MLQTHWQHVKLHPNISEQLIFIAFIVPNILNRLEPNLVEEIMELYNLATFFSVSLASV